MARTAVLKTLRLTGRLTRRSSPTVVLLVLSVCVLIQPVSAQQDTPSHRVLGNGMPSFGGGASQMELLRRLQMLSGAAQAKGNELLNSRKTDPQTMDSLRRAMQQLQAANGQPGNSTLPELPDTRSLPGEPAATSGSREAGPNGESPPALTPGGSVAGNSGDRSKDVTSERPNRTALQRIAEQMGLSLEPRPGRPPGPAAGSRGQGPGTQNQQPASQSPSRTRNPGDVPLFPPQSEDVEEPGGQTLPNPAGGTESGRGSTDRRSSERSGASRAGGNPTNRRDSGSRTGSESRASRNSTSSNPAGATTGHTAGNQGTPDRQNQGSPPSTDSRAQEAPKSSMRSLIDWLAGRKSSNSGISERQGGEARSESTGGSPGQTIADSLRSGEPEGSDGAVTIDDSGRSENSQAANETNSDRGNEDRRRGSGGGNDQESESIEDRLKAQRDERLDELRDSSRSLRQKLIDIARLARSESRPELSSEAPQADEGSGGIQAAFTDMLAEATKGLTEHVDDLVTRDRMTRSGRGRWRPERRDDREGPFGRFSRIGDRASEWLADTVEPETMSVAADESDRAGTGLSESGSPVLVFLALLVGGGLIFWFQQRRADSGSLASVDAVQSAAPSALNNRQDIVQAFHDLAARCPTLIADWWTHDRAAQALAVSRPDVTDDVRQLARLYEQARYLPDESALTEEQLAAAKAAWLRCRHS